MSQWQRNAAAVLRDDLTVMGQRIMPTNRDGFDDEFDELRAVDYRVRCNRDEFFTASLGSNMSKNRFRDVLPNEGTRVALGAVNDRGDGDYINANYVDGRHLFGVPFVYIATQAPLRSTIGDFWRMVWENNSQFIVMLCAEVESGKVKSEKYWPDAVGEVVSVGVLNVVLLTENFRQDTIFRTFALRTLEGRERIIQHFMFTRWPDQSIPESSQGLMDIIYALGQQPECTTAPIVVHCTGGIGRTGVFITLHVALSLFQMEEAVSVPRIVQHIKLCRTGSVQRKDQYLFCYYAILREMERMIWQVETRQHMNSKMQHIPRPGTARRQSQYLPSHPAQRSPYMEKSQLPLAWVGKDPRNASTASALRSAVEGHHTSIHASPKVNVANWDRSVEQASNLEEEVRRLQLENAKQRQVQTHYIHMPPLTPGRVDGTPSSAPRVPLQQGSPMGMGGLGSGGSSLPPSQQHGSPNQSPSTQHQRMTPLPGDFTTGTAADTTANAPNIGGVVIAGGTQEAQPTLTSLTSPNRTPMKLFNDGAGSKSGPTNPFAAAPMYSPAEAGMSPNSSSHVADVSPIHRDEIPPPRPRSSTNPPDRDGTVFRMETQPSAPSRASATSIGTAPPRAGGTGQLQSAISSFNSSMFGASKKRDASLL